MSIHPHRCDRARRWTAAAALAAMASLVALTGCTWGHEQAPGNPRPVVFPGEARLGSTAAIVLDSNYIPQGDSLEYHDIDPSRVSIWIEDASGVVEASLRSVFPLHADRSSQIALTKPGAWVLVALFDLPTDAEMALSTFPAYQEVIVEIDGAEKVPAGLIKIVGPGGEPSSLNGAPLLDALEETLQAGTVLRLRAVWTDGVVEGFDPAWQIAGLQLDLQFDPGCLASPRAYAVGEAVRGTATVGVVEPGGGSGGYDLATLLLVDPYGFTLIDSGNADPTVGGQGPFIDVAFDRINHETCTAALEEYVALENLVVTDRDGARLLDLTGSLGPDSSRYFIVRSLDPERTIQ